MNTMALEDCKKELADRGDELSLNALNYIELGEMVKHDMQLYIWGLEAKVKRLELERRLRREI